MSDDNEKREHPVIGEIAVPLHQVWHDKEHGRGVIFMGAAGCGGEGTIDGEKVYVQPAGLIVQVKFGEENDPDRDYLIDLAELITSVYDYDKKRRGKSL